MRLLSRFWQLPSERQTLLLEATATLALASAALSLLPFKRAIRLGSIPLGELAAGTSDDVTWAIEKVAPRLPWRNMCIQKGIAAQRMLRRRGFDAILQYGIGNDGDTLSAHVWVNLDGVPVIGGEEARAFAPVGAFP